MHQPLKLLICPEAEADLYAYRRGREGATVRIIRGRRCAVIDRCMAEWAAALQFPYVFEGTWESFAHCLRDLHLTAGGKVVILITNLDRVLPRATADFAQLFQTLGDHANQPHGGSGLAMELVLHVEQRSAEQVQKRLAAAVIEYASLEGAGR
jgi:hypothetical protein